MLASPHSSRHLPAQHAWPRQDLPGLLPQLYRHFMASCQRGRGQRTLHSEWVLRVWTVSFKETFLLWDVPAPPTDTVSLEPHSGLGRNTAEVALALKELPVKQVHNETVLMLGRLEPAKEGNLDRT